MPRVDTIAGADTDAAYDTVMDAIVTQRLSPSQKVSENLLCDMFAISRSVARNVIERLIARQLLVSVSPRVTRVAPLTLLEVKQNFALRKLFEPEVCVLAAPHLDYATLAKLNQAMVHSAPITDDDTALTLLKANKRLNLYICGKSNYPLLAHWMHQLEDTAMRVYWLYVNAVKAMPFTPEHQAQLIDAMKTGDAGRIRNLSNDILSLNEDRLLNALFSHEQFYTQDLLIRRSSD